MNKFILIFLATVMFTFADPIYVTVGYQGNLWTEEFYEGSTSLPPGATVGVIEGMNLLPDLESECFKMSFWYDADNTYPSYIWDGAEQITSGLILGEGENAPLVTLETIDAQETLGEITLLEIFREDDLHFLTHTYTFDGVDQFSDLIVGSRGSYEEFGTFHYDGRPDFWTHADVTVGFDVKVCYVGNTPDPVHCIPVPEPSSILLLGFGLLGLIGFRSLKKQSKL